MVSEQIQNYLRRRLRDQRSRAYVIAGLADCHHRPVRRWLDGGLLPGGAIGERVKEIALELGIEPLTTDGSHAA